MAGLPDETLRTIIKDALTAARAARRGVDEQVDEILDALDDACAFGTYAEDGSLRFDLPAPGAIASRERIALDPDVVVERNGNGSILAIEIAD
jgi:hypothetical protein